MGILFWGVWTKDTQDYPGPFAFSTLLQKHCNKKQELEECVLKLCGYTYHQGTYTALSGY